jgi:hypothetical protein
VGLLINVSLTGLREAPRSFYISLSEDKTREREMQPQGELSQSPGHKIQYFWEWFSFKTDKLKEYEPQRRFDSLYTHLVNLSENLKGDSHIIRENFVYQMLKSITSSLCYIAPLPIIMYSSNTKLYEFGVLRGRSGEILSVMLEYEVEDNKATLSNIYEINECFEPVDPDVVENVIMWTGFRHADELYIEIPGVYKKIGVVFNDNKIEVRKIEE